MTTFTWDNVLSTIREGKQTIPTSPNGIPVVAVNAPFYELMQLIEALTSGYNQQVDTIKHLDEKLSMMRNLAKKNFSDNRKTNDVRCNKEK